MCFCVFCCLFCVSGRFSDRAVSILGSVFLWLRFCRQKPPCISPPGRYATDLELVAPNDFPPVLVYVDDTSDGVSLRSSACTVRSHFGEQQYVHYCSYFVLDVPTASSKSCKAHGGPIVVAAFVHDKFDPSTALPSADCGGGRCWSRAIPFIKRTSAAISIQSCAILQTGT